jgi:pilus assembly protein CpaC
VPRQEDLDRLEQLLGAYGRSVTNLVVVPPPPPPPIPPSVRLTVQLVEMSRNDTDKLGVDWMDSLTFTETAFGAVDVGGASLSARVREAFRFGSLSRTGAKAVVNMLVSQGKARILAEPKLVASSGKEATTTLGVEVPVIQATSIGTNTESVNASIDFRETGVLLKMTPTVIETDAGQKITTVLLSEVSDLDKSVGLSVPVGSQTIVVPGFKVRKTSTEVTTVSGETIVIAGLLEFEESRAMSQVPGFGNIPVLGRLFRTPEVTDTRNELVITVTPEILGDQANQAERGLALEQAMAVAEVTASVQDPRLRYALQVQDRIAKQLRYPEREKELGLDGTVKLRLHLFRDGTLGRAIVSASSGIEALDMEALKVAETQAPYPSFPSQLVEQELWLEVPVIFRP